MRATDAWFILCTNKIYTYVLKKSYFIFSLSKISVNALNKLAGFSTSNKVTKHSLKTLTRLLSENLISVTNSRKLKIEQIKLYVCIPFIYHLIILLILTPRIFRMSPTNSHLLFHWWEIPTVITTCWDARR